jgi:hypothetical protein
MARPKAVIDWNKVDKYLQAQCDGVGIAGLLGISPDTLYRACQEVHKMGFAEYSAIKKAEGVELLKAKQYQVAMEGDKTMLVWLGKQYAGQSDKSENRITGPIKIIVSYEEGPAEGNPLEI